MTNSVLLGLILVVLGGFLTGTGPWPFKVTRDLNLEKFLLFNIGTSFVFLPWLIAFCCLDVPTLFQSIDQKMLLRSFLFSAGWGAANVLFWVCVLKIGAALTGAFLFSLGTTVVMICPMILKGSGIFQDSPDLFSTAGLFVSISIVVIIFGVVLLTIAGFGREKALSGRNEEEKRKMASGNFLEGLILVIVAGVLSAGLALSFVYSQDSVIKAAQAQGMSEFWATPVAWGICAGGGALINILFAVFLLIKNGTWKSIFARYDESVFGILSGVQWFFSLLSYGLGMIYLGPLGGVVGNGIQQAVSLLSNQLVGFLGGEWKGVFGLPRRMVYLGIVIILISIALMAYSNQIGSTN